MSCITVLSGKSFQYVECELNHTIVIPSGRIGGDTFITSSRSNIFANSNLSAGVYSFTHGLGKYPLVVVYDNTGNVIQPDAITYVDYSSVNISLNSYLPLTGNWTVVAQ